MKNWLKSEKGYIDEEVLIGGCGCAVKTFYKYIQQLENKQQKVIEKLKKDKKKNNELEFIPLQVEKAYNNYYKLGKIDEIDEILEIIRGET